MDDDKDDAYDFHEDLLELVQELETNIGREEKNPARLANIYIQVFKDILKKEKKSLYVLTPSSKLAIDKARYRKIYTYLGPLDIVIKPLNLWELHLDPSIFNRLVLVDKKQNQLKMVGGISLPGIRSSFVLHVKFESPEKKVEVAKQMKLYQMKPEELKFFKHLLDKAREEIHTQMQSKDK